MRIPDGTADESMLLHLLGHPAEQLLPLLLILHKNYTGAISIFDFFFSFLSISFSLNSLKTKD
jgi:hypothetical protein